MLNSGLRKRALSGWLQKYQSEEYSSSLKLQKFLFLYESYSKIEGDQSADFHSLKGYVNGPVFSDVYGDYTHRKEEFNLSLEEAYELKSDIIDNDRAKFSGFLVKILNENELSDLTHELNIWKAKKREIDAGLKHIPLYETDFNNDDIELLVSLREMYSTQYIDSVEIINIGNKSFIINKSDVSRLTTEQESIFINLANDETLENPVYITISDDGVVLVD